MNRRVQGFNFRSQAGTYLSRWSICWLVVLLWVGNLAGETVVYVSLGEENAIAVYRLEAKTGELAPSSRIEVAGSPGSLAIDPSRGYLYAAIRSADSVATLRITKPYGGLVPAGMTRVVGNPVYIVCDRTGRWLLSAYYEAGKTAIHPISRDGGIERTASQILDVETHPHCIAVSRENEFVYVSNTGSDGVLQYRLNVQRGTLDALPTPRVAAKAGAGPRHFVWHPTLPIIYVANEIDSTVATYRIEPRTGQLTEIARLATLPQGFSGKNTCADIHVNPAGTFVYVSNRGHDSLAMFQVQPGDGRLSFLGCEATESTPREFDIDPTGQYLFAAGQSSGRLAAYRIESSTGRLRKFATYEVGRGPCWVTIVDLAE